MTAQLAQCQILLDDAHRLMTGGWLTTEDLKGLDLLLVGG